MSGKNLIKLDQLSNPADLVVLGLNAVLNPETEKLIDNLEDNVKKDFQNYIFQSSFWKKLENSQAPLDLIKYRKGPKNKETGEDTWLEFLPEDYTIQELNRVFPGWWCEDMDHGESLQLRVAWVTGYLCVEYPTLQGLKPTKRWAKGAERIEYKKDTDYASQPEDVMAAARTRWLKLAGKWYGIGLEIYHQRVTPELRSAFEDIVRFWGVYGEDAKAIAASIETGQGFRSFLKEFPTPEQTDKLMTYLQDIPKDLENKGGENIHHVIWSNFIKLKNDSAKNRKKTEDFLKQIKETAEQLKNKTK